MGIIKDRLRDAMIVYRRNHDLLRFIKEVGDIADSHIHYQWQRTHFDNKLDEVFKELLGNGNPSHRKGSIEIVEDKFFEPCQYVFAVKDMKNNNNVVLYWVLMKNIKDKSGKVWLVSICPYFQQADNLIKILRTAGNSQLLRLTYVAEERDDMKNVLFS